MVYSTPLLGHECWEIWGDSHHLCNFMKMEPTRLTTSMRSSRMWRKCTLRSKVSPPSSLPPSPSLPPLPPLISLPSPPSLSSPPSPTLPSLPSLSYPPLPPLPFSSSPPSPPFPTLPSLLLSPSCHLLYLLCFHFCFPDAVPGWFQHGLFKTIKLVLSISQGTLILP